jgi:gliding motility associated protien GldN
MKKITVIIGLLISALISIQAQDNTFKPPLDNFYVKVNNEGEKARPYVNVRQADVYYDLMVWRQIDMREKFNQYLYYPTKPVQDRYSFMSMIMKELKEGNIQAYDASTDDFSVPTTYEEIMANNTSTIEKEVEDLDNPGEMIKQTTVTGFNIEDITILRIKEKYFIDKQRGVKEVRILGICPVIQIYDDNGEFIGNKTLFWIYYPDCRDIFANYEAFNRHNSAMRLSYDDVFTEKRFFNSYIIKYDNAQDRSIQEYCTGQQILLEAERIKEMLFNKEQDLWEY